MTKQRNELIDALRALALLPVFAVNFASFAYGYDTSNLGLTEPQGAWHAIASVWFISFALQAKGVTLLAFLVGVSLVLSSRASARRGLSAQQFSQAQGTRLFKQGVLGVLHGALLYFGDILLTYAGAGYIVLLIRRWKLRRLLRLAFVLFGINLVLASVVAIDILTELTAHVSDWETIDPEPAFAAASTWWELWGVNLENWRSGTAMQLYFVSLFAVPPILLGLIAARLQWLTHPRWQAQRARWARKLCLPAIALNALAASLFTWGIELRVKEIESLGQACMTIAAPLAVAAFVCWVCSRTFFAQPHSRFAKAIGFVAPLGRYSLSAYLAGSITMNVLYAGPALALSLESAGLFIAAIAFWFLCLFTARAASKRRLQGLPEKWLSVSRHVK